jgi:hypothetical protein
LVYGMLSNEVPVMPLSLPTPAPWLMRGLKFLQRREEDSHLVCQHTY